MKKPRAVRLYETKTKAELGEMLQQIKPDNQNGGIYLYKPSTSKKMDDIAWAITYHMADERKPSVDGYSGRNSNRRR